MSAIDEYLTNNQSYKANNGSGALPMPPARHVAVGACMDARLDVYRMLGLHEGEAHVIRNAGGVVTENALRSLVISQRLLGTTETALIHHTDCGMLTFRDEQCASNSRRKSVRSRSTRFKRLAISPPTCAKG